MSARPLLIAMMLCACKDPSTARSSRVRGSAFGSATRDAPPTADMVRVPRTGGVPEFFIDKYEVTYEQYSQCVGDMVCNHEYDGGEQGGPCWEDTVDRGKIANRPVACVAPNDAEKYCVYRHKRLPSKAEWLHAALGDDGRRWPWGNDAPSCTYAVMNVGSGCAPTSTLPVGSRPAGASPYGAQDLVGNVAEYVWDPDSQDPDPFVLMGGDYHSSVGALHDLQMERGAFWEAPQFGFRCAWSEDMGERDGKIRRVR